MAMDLFLHTYFTRIFEPLSCIGFHFKNAAIVVHSTSDPFRLARSITYQVQKIMRPRALICSLVCVPSGLFSVHCVQHYRRVSRTPPPPRKVCFPTTVLPPP